MKVGFDLDKIFINIPPFVPAKVIDWLYKGKANGSLKYRIPGKTEQIFRLFSHNSLFRPPITKNMNYVKELAEKNTNTYYLISSRFSFLEKKTARIIKRYKLDEIFNGMYFNYSNSQPHLFKDKIIKNLHLNIYVDDDLELLKYLANKNPKTNFFWLNQEKTNKLNKNLFAIQNLSEIFTYSKPTK